MRYLFPVMLFLSLSLIITPFASSQDDILRLIEKKQKELKEREENLKKEEERLNLLKKELDEKIDRYSKILAEIEGQLKELKKARDDRFEQVVKTFEAMPPEDAATRLNEMDEKTATKIISMMKPKKASAIMAAMEPKKVAGLTSRILDKEKKFPTR
ncbi:MAG: MotE family protein [Thermodesulfovibrionales bacterium]